MLAALQGFKETYREDELLEVLIEKANKNCKQCYGRGYTGYIDEMLPQDHKKGEKKVPLKVKFYIPCYKCFKEKEPKVNIKL